MWSATVIYAMTLPLVAVAQQWTITDWTPRCQSGVECNLEEYAEEAGFVVDQLKESSIRLGQYGFKKPNIRTAGPAGEEKYLVLFGQESLVGGHAGEYNLSSRSLVVSLGADNFFQVQYADEEDDEAELDNTRVGAHELFHAVQGSYSYFVKDVKNRYNWFDEGTAAAVEALTGVEAPLEERLQSIGRPYYDYPIDKLKSQLGPELDDYMSYQFWASVGVSHNGPAPLTYLTELMPKLDGKVDPILSLDNALEQVVGGGFWYLYPRFLASFATRDYFENHGLITLPRGRNRLDDSWQSTTGEVDRLAAGYWDVQVPDIGRTEALLEIVLEGKDSSALYLIVDDEVIGETTPGERNVFRKIMNEPEGFAVIVANVAQNANESKKQSYTLKTRLLSEYALMGRGAGGGPSAADIDTPLPFELPDIKQALVMPGPLELHVKAGLEDVCMMQLQMTNPDTGDSLLLKMDKEGPFRPESYYVHRGASFKTETFPGEFVTLMSIGPGNAMSSGWTLSYNGVSGYVTLDSVSGHYIKGHANLNLEYGKVFDCLNPMGIPPRLGNNVKCPETLRNIVVNVQFGVFPGLIRGTEILGKSINRCTGDRPAGRSGSGAATPTDTSPPPPGGVAPPPPPGDQDDSGGLALPGSTLPGRPELPGAESNPISGGGEGYWIDENVARWFRLKASGDIDTVVAFQDFQLAGGCGGSTPINMGFFQGNLNSDNYEQLSFETEDIVSTGETGVFSLREITWDYGTTSVHNMPVELNIRVPNRFSGSGTLELTTHNAVSGERRMRGVIRGAGLTNSSGQTTDIEAEFQADWSCGVQLQ